MPVEEIEWDEPCSPEGEAVTIKVVYGYPQSVPRRHSQDFRICPMSAVSFFRRESPHRRTRLFGYTLWTSKGREPCFSPSIGGLRDSIPELTTSMFPGLLPGGEAEMKTMLVE
jgi:hypothetical protein